MSVAMPDSRANCAGETTPNCRSPATAQALRVMLPLPLPGLLDYVLPADAAAPEPGSFVRVTLGPRRAIGVVWDGKPEIDRPIEQLKPVCETLPTPPLRPELRRFIERVADYTLASPGAVLRM